MKRTTFCNIVSNRKDGGSIFFNGETWYLEKKSGKDQQKNPANVWYLKRQRIPKQLFLRLVEVILFGSLIKLNVVFVGII